MNELLVIALLVVSIFVLLGCGIWVGLTLIGTAWIGMELFSSRPAGDAMSLTIWGASSGWTLTALPLFLWMGEILFRTRLSQDLFKGLAPWLEFLPGRLVHTNVIGCGIFAAVSGSSAATCATIGKMSLPELKKRGYPDDLVIGTLAGAGTLGLLVPPSIIMIVYGVATDVSISRLFIAGVLPALLLAGLFRGYIGLPRALAEWIGSLGLSQFGLVMALMVFFIVLGCFLDGISMVVLTMGVLLPTVTAAGIDLIWFGVFVVFVVEMAQITPPVGFNLFVLAGMTGREISYIARVALPMFLLMVFAVLILYFVPDIATWLPRNMKL